MTGQNWDEIQSALHVARTGTLSRAASELGLHHTTVLRQIDALEARLGVRLFFRGRRGYTLTAAGRRFLVAAERMDQAAAEVALTLKPEHEVAGDLTMTTVPILSGIVTDVADHLRRDHPRLRIRIVTETRLLRLDRGEADVALRPGPKPQEEDYVVLSLPPVAFALYASRLYAAAHPHLAHRPLEEQVFLGTEGDELRATHYAWLAENVSPDNIPMVSTDPAARLQDILRGMGLGFLPEVTANRAGTLIQVAPPREEWKTPVWLVTHRETHRTARIQAAVAMFRRCVERYAYRDSA